MTGLIIEWEMFAMVALIVAAFAWAVGAPMWAGAMFYVALRIYLED